MAMSVPSGCTDPETGAQFWRFLAEEIIVPDVKERVRLHKHSVNCPACRTQVLESWVRENMEEILRRVTNRAHEGDPPSLPNMPRLGKTKFKDE
jgi:hypothetical protein